MKGKAREIRALDDSGLETTQLIATALPARDAQVKRVIEASQGKNGRSEWYWFRLQNGDLVLGVYPCGDTYEEITQVGSGIGI
jgi:hypothetical protein